MIVIPRKEFTCKEKTLLSQSEDLSIKYYSVIFQNGAKATVREQMMDSNKYSTPELENFRQLQFSREITFLKFHEA